MTGNIHNLVWLRCSVFLLGLTLTACVNVSSPSFFRKSSSLISGEKLFRLVEEEEFRQAQVLFDTNQYSEEPITLYFGGEELTAEWLVIKADQVFERSADDVNTAVEDKSWQLARQILFDMQERFPARYGLRIEQLASSLVEARKKQIDGAILEANIERGQWLSQLESVYQFKAAESVIMASAWYEIRRKWVIGRQNRLAKSLLTAANKAIDEGDYLVANRIYGTLSKFKLAAGLEERYVQLGYSLLERVELIIAEFGSELPHGESDNISVHQGVNGKLMEGGAKKGSSHAHRSKQTIDSWIANIRHMIREGRLIEIKVLLDRLDSVALTHAQRKEVNSAKGYLDVQVNMLDSHAERLYSKGSVSDAHSIWALLRKVDRDNEEFRLKYNRSGKVLGNMQELREEGYFRMEVN